MSTRALYTFFQKTDDENERHHVYKHSDGYPGEWGALHMINRAKLFAWTLPRFEPDEFAAAFITAGKIDHTWGALIDAGRAEVERRVAEYEAAPQDLPAGEREQLSDRYFGNQLWTPDEGLKLPGYHAMDMGGQMRLVGSNCPWGNVAPDDIEYRYEITEKKGSLMVGVFSVSCSYLTGDWSEKKLFAGTLEAAMAHFKAHGCEPASEEPKLQADADPIPPAMISRTRRRFEMAGA